ncbi:MAG: Cache 3/Cache 2 fusion domain-containing protein, partial [Flammeovirgaceae bacterium]|nr:Cache 3/Cache 2 fusion domain-containing protein [Flammeovirgaceae bacterium]MDW8288597.1 Cache 3/Cache 2 fusion domain-containing protein [Flammeovirgaceae bacterium]
MIFFKGLKLRQRFALLTAIVLTTLLSIFCYTIYRTQEAKILRSNEERMLSHLEDVATLFDLTLKEKQEAINHAINVAYYFLGNPDSIIVTENQFPVRTVNVVTKDTLEQEMKEWYVKNTLLHRNAQLLNNIQELTGIAVGFYQKTLNGYLSMATTFNEGGLSYLIPYDSAMVRAMERGLRHQARYTFLGDTYSSVFVPITQRNQVIGVMQLGYNHRKDLISLREKLAEKRYFTSGYPFAFDREGKILIHPIRAGQTIENAEFFRTMLQNKRGKIFSQENGRLMIMYYNHYEPIDVFLVCAVPELELVEAPLRQLRLVIFLGFFITLILMILVINYLMKEVSDDIKVMVKGLQELALGRYPKTQVKNKDEIGEMSRSLNTFVNSLQEAATFAENVGKNKFDSDFKPLSEEDRLGNALIGMRNNLKRIAEEDKQRNWANEGYAKFAELLRQQYDSIEELGSVLIEQVINYLN